MKVTFSIEVEEGKIRGEAELVQAVPPLKETFPPDADIEGEVVFPAELEGEPLRFHDMLTYLIPEICLRSIPTLVEGHPFVADFASSPMTVTLTPDQDAVVLSCSEFEDTFRFPRADFIRALFDCGERFLAFWGDLRDDSNTQHHLKIHGVKAAKAREALARLG